MSPAVIARLRQLAEMRKVRDQGEVARLSKGLGAIAAARATLGQTARRDLPRMGANDPSALFAYGKWSALSATQRHGLDALEAELEAKREAARTVLRRSFGQVQALDQLHRRALEERRRIRQRSAEQEGLPPED